MPVRAIALPPPAVLQAAPRARLFTPAARSELRSGVPWRGAGRTRLRRPSSAARRLRPTAGMPRSLVGTVRAPCLSCRTRLTSRGSQVVSNKMMKSVTVAVTRLFRHTRLGKTIRETKKYMVRRRRCEPKPERGTLSSSRR